MTVWKAKAERGSAWLIRSITWMARTAGRPVCRALLYPIVLYFVATDTVARRASREFLETLHGRPASWADVFAHVHAFAGTLLDRVYMANGDFRRFRVTIEGASLVADALRFGKGCLLLGSHLGSFDLMTLANRALNGQPVSVLMHADPRSRLRRIAGIDDEACGVIALGRPASMLRGYQVLESGGLLAALADRVDGAGASLRARFAGRVASFPLGPHVLAARAGARVLMCFGLYEGGASYRIEFIDFGPPADKDSRGAAMQPVVDRYAALLEQYARRYPNNWFNFYPYWNAP
jgi:predicted LPLAT superfamily acyltransferase